MRNEKRDTIAETVFGPFFMFGFVEEWRRTVVVNRTWGLALMGEAWVCGCIDWC